MTSVIWPATRRQDGFGNEVHGQRHRRLRAAACLIYSVPQARRLTRLTTRLSLQRLPLSTKNKQRLYNFFSSDTAPAEAIPCSVRLPLGGCLKLKLNLQDDLSRLWYYWGYLGYEMATARFLSRLASTKSCVFDAGSNIGYHTLLMSASIQGRGEVHSFEPRPDVFDSLELNAKLNNFSCLRLNRIALSDKDGFDRLFLPSDFAWPNASLVHGFTGQAYYINVETLRLDTYWTEKCSRPVDLVKIDAEGAELRVLKGMGSLLDVWQPDIVCEVLEPYDKALSDFFRSKPYRKFLITDSGLVEADEIRADPRFRDYYLSCNASQSVGRAVSR
jgi:FkbM family methyltransferase